MASIADLLESFRNYRGVEDWKLKKLQDMLGAGQNIDLRQSINDRLNQSADPLGLYSRYGMEAPYSYGDVAQQALGATDLYAPIAAGEAIEAAKKGEWKKSGLSALGALPIIGALKASHGSPHAFTKFDFSKIGTGEGAQAYGHGGYFAQGFDSPVAQGYRATTTKGFNLPDGESIQGIANLLAFRGDKGEEMVRKHYANLGDKLEPTIQAAKKAIDENSHLYNVELKWPDAAREAADPLGEHHLLDWNAPMSQQPQGVRKAFDAFVNSPEGETLAKEYWSHKPGMKLSDLPEWNDVSGEAIYKNGLGSAGWEKANALLQQYGIPGIRYLDQGSRGAGIGSRNFVIFDDQIPNIVSRNGVSLTDLLRR